MKAPLSPHSFPPRGERVDQEVAMEQLTPDQQELLANLLETYLERLERGEPGDWQELAGAHPSLAGPLQSYVKSLEFMHAAVHDSTPSAGRGAEPASAMPRLDFHFDGPSAKQIGEYRLVRELGRGGMGIVYEAYQQSLGRRVALKVLPFAAVLDDRQIARFHNEAQAAAQLHHPHIVPVYAVGCERGVHFYSMQLIDGQSLDRVIKDRRGTAPTDLRLQERTAEIWHELVAEPLPQVTPTTNEDSAPPSAPSELSTVQTVRSRRYVRSIVEIGIQAAEALAHAHTCGVIHRDIKPSNLLLDPTGKLWVADFGLARLEAGRDLTRAGELLGTVRYMSPEQASGQSHLVDHRTDIYALGVTLFELLTLQVPFAGTDRQEILRKIAQDEPTSPRRLNRSIGPDLENILLKALAKEREDRYANAQAFADDLRCYLDNRPTQARPITRLDRWSRLAWRHKQWWPWLASAAALGVVGLLSLSAVLATANARYEAERQKAELHLTTAHRAVHELGGSAADALRWIPGTEPVRQQMLDATLEYYESFLRYADHQPALRADCARIESQRGLLLDQLGRTSEAAVSYASAQETFDSLLRQHPADHALRADAAICACNYGTVLVQLGHWEAAARHYHTAISEQSALLAGAAAEQRAPLADRLAQSYLNLGRLHTHMRQLVPAEQALSTALALLAQDAVTNSQQTEHSAPLAAVHAALAALPHHDHTQRAEHLRMAIRLYEKRMRETPRDLACMRELGLVHLQLGSLQAEQAGYEGADQAYTAAFTLQETLCQLAPHYPQFQSDLATTWNNRGQLALTQHEVDHAEQAFKKARGILEGLCQANPDQILFRSSLGGVWHNLSLVYEEQQQWVPATQALQAAIEHQQFAYDKAPQGDRYRHFLEQHRANLSRLRKTLEQTSVDASQPVSGAG